MTMEENTEMQTEMSIEKIVSGEQKRIFSLKEARSLLPLVYRITDSAHRRVKKLINRLEALKGQESLLGGQLEGEIETEVSKWQNKLTRLGIKPKGMWLADFDSGKCYYCWKFPETEIKYEHAYQDGFSGRAEIHKSI
jgi:hypothetical protein